MAHYGVPFAGSSSAADEALADAVMPQFTPLLGCHSPTMSPGPRRYGCKQEATALLQEWVRDVGVVAGLSADNTRLSSGSIGVPESRLEV